MDRVAGRYRKVLEEKGISLSGAQLLDWADSQGIRGVSRAAVYKFLREEAPSDLGAFAKAKKVKHYQTVSPLRPGVYFIDYGEFHKNWAGSNSGATGFLVAVENVTCRLFVLPTRGKDTKQWLNSIARFVELTRQVSTIYSDRDAVATSAAFRDRLIRDYKIRWNFLRGRNKSFLAERLIGYVKTKLSQSLLHKRRTQSASFKRWIDFVPDLVEEYNNQRVPGTRYRRKTISRENFNQFLAQLFGDDENFDLRFNSYSVPPFAHHPAWNRKIFKFDLGDRVRVSRKADWTDPENRAAGFAKASSRGAYGQKTYPVVGRQLRATKDWKRYVPVYLLGDMPDGAGYTFYEADLVRSAASE